MDKLQGLLLRPLNYARKEPGINLGAIKIAKEISSNKI